MKLDVTFTPQSIDTEVSTPVLDTSTGIAVTRIYEERPAYTGPYEITPTAQEQTLSTKNKRMTDDIVIAPIPSNYGLITWNGSTITVS